MKKTAVLLGMILLAFWGNTAMAQTMRPEINRTGTLTIAMRGFTHDKGNAMIALCNSKEDFAKREGWFRGASAPIRGGKSEWTFTGLPYGTYAVKVYHDENGNGTLDTNSFGAPKEAYGFSNNARATFGPPSFEEAGFSIDKPGMTIVITLK